MVLPTHKTKIVCTIGPASESREVMEQMIRAGMNIARLNLSHGDFEGHQRVIESIRTAASPVGRRVAIMADLSGAQDANRSIGEGAVGAAPGRRVLAYHPDNAGDENRVSVTFARLLKPYNQGILYF